MQEIFTQAFLIQSIKYTVVGGTGTGINFGLTYWLKEKVRINAYIANSIGFGISITLNYILNRVWTFESDNPDILQEYGIFMTVAGTGLLLNHYCVYFLSTRYKINFYIAKLIAVTVVGMWNFFLNTFYTFA